MTVAFQADFLLRESVFESDVLRGAQDTNLHAASLREPMKSMMPIGLPVRLVVGEGRTSLIYS